MRKRKDIMRLVEEIVKLFGPEKVILFGSYAYGRPDVHSDVDILVVFKDSKNTLDTAVAIRQAISHDLPVDIIVRTTQQIEKRLKWGDSFIREVLEKGKVIYEAAS